MNTFWGCEPEALIDLSTVFGTGAARIRHLIEKSVEAVHSTDWQGPDADEHRLRTMDAVERMTHLIGALRKLEERLQQEAAEQTACSRAETGSVHVDDPFGIRAAPPWVSSPVDLPQLQGAGSPAWGPMVGGPFAVEDPSALADELPALEDMVPLVGGPFQSRNPLWTSGPRQAAEGPDLGTDPDLLSEAD